MDVIVPVSIGEWIDKLTILEIKLAAIRDPAKLENVRRELQALALAGPESLASRSDLEGLRSELRIVNEKLWRIEDEIRKHERTRTFGDAFVVLARSVYIVNDRRAALKREINRIAGSGLVEEKSYAAY